MLHFVSKFPTAQKYYKNSLFKNWILIYCLSSSQPTAQNVTEEENLLEPQFSSPNFDLFWDVVLQMPTIVDIISRSFPAESGVLNTLSKLKSTVRQLTPQLESMIPIGPNSRVDQITTLWKQSIALLRGLINIIIIARPADETTSEVTSAAQEIEPQLPTIKTDEGLNSSATAKSSAESKSWIKMLEGILEQLLGQMDALAVGAAGDGNKMQPNETRATIERMLALFDQIKQLQYRKSVEGAFD